MTSAISIAGLKKNFAGVQALDGIDLEVSAGSLYGIIGADGAGKTTLMRIISTLIRPDSGNISVLSHDTKRSLKKIRTSIGYMPQKFSLYEDLSVRENMLFFADIFGVRSRERTERITRLLSFSRLGSFQNRRAQNLSGGMKQKLALSCALIHTPQLLILDEPTTGVDPVSRTEFWEILGDLRRQGMTIVVSTPYMEEAEYCSELTLLHKGKVLLRGTPDQLCNAYPLKLYRISSDTGSLTYSSKEKRPDGISLIYPSGGDLHVASSLKDESTDAVLKRIRTVVEKADRASPIDPRMEDIIFYYLSEHNPGIGSDKSV